MMHIILMGPQGSGKGTQSERLGRLMNLGLVATGELFRAAIRDETELGKRIKAIYERGDLVPDELTNALVAERLDQLTAERRAGEAVAGALYDGFPRTMPQADALERALAARGEQPTAVIAIDVPRLRLIERLAGRRVCSRCGRVYNVVSDPPRVPGICDACGGELVQRADDTPGAVAKRLDRYEAEIAGLEQRFADQGLLTRIDGDRPIDEVTESIMAAIQARTGQAATRR